MAGAMSTTGETCLGASGQAAEGVEASQSSTVAMKHFPKSWAGTPVGELGSKIKKLLSKFGELRMPPKVTSAPGAPLEAVVVFARPSTAEEVVKTLHGADMRSKAEKKAAGQKAPEEHDLFWAQVLRQEVASRPSLQPDVQERRREIDDKLEAGSSCTVAMKHFPKSWVGTGVRGELGNKIRKLLSQFGQTQQPPKVTSAPGAPIEVVVVFEKASIAEEVVKRLHGTDMRSKEEKKAAGLLPPDECDRFWAQIKRQEPAALPSLPGEDREEASLVVGGFPPSYGESELKCIFMAFSGISTIGFMSDPVTNQRYARIELKEAASMAKAAEQLNATLVGDGDVIEECLLTCVLDVGVVERARLAEEARLRKIEEKEEAERRRKEREEAAAKVVAAMEEKAIAAAAEAERQEREKEEAKATAAERSARFQAELRQTHRTAAEKAAEEKKIREEKRRKWEEECMRVEEEWQRSCEEEEKTAVQRYEQEKQRREEERKRKEEKMRRWEEARMSREEQSQKRYAEKKEDDSRKRELKMRR